MGVGNETGGGAWLSVVKGTLTQRVKAGTEGAQERTIEKGPNAGSIVHELRYNYLEGKLERIYIQETDYGKSWVFVVDDGQKAYNLTTGYSSGYAVGLLSRLLNVKLSVDIKIKSFYIKGDDDKYRGYLTIEQGGQKVEKAFTKEEPNGLPEVERVTINGEPVWDSTKRMQFFEKLVETTMAKVAQDNPLADESLEDLPPEQEPDELPF